MDLRELGRVGLKLFGIWTALSSITWLLGLLQFFVDPLIPATDRARLDAA